MEAVFRMENVMLHKSGAEEDPKVYMGVPLI